MVKTLLIAGAAIVVVYLLTRPGGTGFALTPPGYRPPAPNPNLAKTGDANVWSFLSTAATAIGKGIGGSSGSSGSSSSSPSTPPKYSDDLMTPTWV